MIPTELISPPASQMLGEYLVEEIHQSLSARRKLEERWKQFHRIYRALPEEEIKTFPFHGAANLVVPVAATDIDVIYARLMGILFAPDNLFSTRPKRPEMVEFARVLQEFLQAVQYSELNAYHAIGDWVMEIIKLGTGVIKTRYRREHKTVYEFREIGNQSQESHEELRVKDHPVFEHVSLFDFLIPPTALDIDDSPWVAERVLLTWQQFFNRVREGIYMFPPGLQNWNATSKGSHVLEEMTRLDAYEPPKGDKLELWECWLDFDIMGMGEPRSIVATIHVPTWSIVRIDWNPYLSQEPPYDVARFLRQEKRFYGIGMCEMLEPFQEEITAMHRQRIDSGTLANSTMFKGRTGAVSEDEPIYPGRWFILDNLDDVQEMPLSSGKMDSSTQYEPLTLEYAKSRSGVNEHVAGQFAPSIGYSTAMTNLQQLEQATQRFDQTLREIRAALTGAANKAVELYQQFDRPGKTFQILGERDGEIMESFIQFPVDAIRESVGIEVTATSASLNREVELRSNTMVMQMMQQFYREVIDALMLAFTPGLPPQIQQTIFQMVQGGSILMRRILDSHGIQDTDDLVPHVREMLSGELPIGQLQSEALLNGQAGHPQLNGAVGQQGAAGLAGLAGGQLPGGIGNGGFLGRGQATPGGHPMLQNGSPLANGGIEPAAR